MNFEFWLLLASGSYLKTKTNADRLGFSSMVSMGTVWFQMGNWVCIWVWDLPLFRGLWSPFPSRSRSWCTGCLSHLLSHLKLSPGLLREGALSPPPPSLIFLSFSLVGCSISLLISHFHVSPDAVRRISSPSSLGWVVSYLSHDIYFLGSHWVVPNPPWAAVTRNFWPQADRMEESPESKDILTI